jgi:aminopeptidase
MDPRIERLAELIINYCTEVKKSERVYLTTNHPAGEPLYKSVRERILSKKAKVFDHFGEENYLDICWVSESFLKNHSLAELGDFPSERLKELEAAEVVIVIVARPDLRNSRVSEDKFLRWAKTIEPLSDKMMEKRYVICPFPTQAYAKIAGTSLEQFQDLFYNACFVDRKKLSENLGQIKKIFDNAQEVQILAKDTNLTFSLEGRVGLIENGKENLPGGELYYAPQERSAKGFITYSYPAVYFGRKIEEVRLEFKEGKIISAKASRNQKTLERILTADPGASYIGEFGIGGNPGVVRVTGELMLDEVRWGTFHFTPGYSYSECGGTNQSVIHLDLIKDLKKEGGKILINGKVVLNFS